MNGCVFLVGAGPGDPSLLTVRAAELLRSADVVAYDALISDAVLAEIGPQAELICVGHRGRGASRADYKIHPDVIARAREGKRVVRLKQGDPLVFGRGGEEAEELRAAGVAFEIVPGVSAALGAAAYAGIPLTLRRVASDVTLATGHDLLAGTPEASDWAALARASGTLVLFMAAKKLGENLARLVDHGRAPSTPAAYIARATTASQRVIVGTLADLVEKTAGVDREQPALIIVGEVVAQRETLAWFERRPLAARRVLVARARPQPSKIAAELRALGAEVIEVPRVSVRAVAPGKVAWSEHDAVVVPSAEAADAVAALPLDERPRAPLIAVGEAALARLRAAGLEPSASFAGACAEDLAGGRDAIAGRRLLVLADQDRRPTLVAELSRLGAQVRTHVAFETSHHFPPPPRDSFDAVVLPSSSAARRLYASDYGRGLVGVRAIAIGATTADAARSSGATRVEQTDSDRPAAVVARVREVLA
jgi:uroporphyrinogen III methyltransferase/synthase